MAMGKIVLIYGSIRQVLMRILSRDEAKQEDLRGWLADDRALFYVGDVRDHRSVDGEMFGVDFACSTQHR